MQERLVVVGGDAGGMAPRRRLGGCVRDELEIVVFERGAYTSYAACGLPYLVAGEVVTPDDLVARSPEAYRESGVEVHTATEVVSIDVERRTVNVRGPDGAVRDRALRRAADRDRRHPDPTAAAGDRCRRRLRPADLPDTLALDEAVRRSERAVVVGAGYIGLEVAEAFRARGLDTTLVELAEQPMVTLDPDMGAQVVEALDASGVDLRLGDAVTGFDVADGRVAGVRTGPGTCPPTSSWSDSASGPTWDSPSRPASPSGPPAGSPSIAACAPVSNVCGRRGTASSRSTGCRASRS